MRRNTSLLQVSFLLIVLIAVGITFWRMYDFSHPKKDPTEEDVTVSLANGMEAPMDMLKRQELLGIHSLQQPFRARRIQPADYEHSVAQRIENGNNTSSEQQAAATNGVQIAAPYWVALPREESRTLRRALANLVSQTEEALARAMSPKTKREEMIEANLPHKVAGTKGPFATVLDRIVEQKQPIVNAMQNAVNGKAADEATISMNAFIHDLTNLVKKDNLAPETKAMETWDLLRSTHNQLQEIVMHHGMDEYVKMLENNDEDLLQELAKSYPDKTLAQLTDVLTHFRQQEITLAKQNLPLEAYYKKSLASRNARQQSLEQVLLRNEQSIRALQAAEDEQERRNLEERSKNRPQTDRAPLPISPEQKKSFYDNLLQERSEKIRMAKQIYGPNGAKLVANTYDKYYASARKIIEDPSLRRLDKQQQLMQVRQQANEDMAALQKRSDMQQWREDRQVETTLQQLLKDSGVANATDLQKAQFAQRARVILHNMFSQINQVAESDLADADKQQRILALQNIAQQQLSAANK